MKRGYDAWALVQLAFVALVIILIAGLISRFFVGGVDSAPSGMRTSVAELRLAIDKFDAKEYSPQKIAEMKKSSKVDSALVPGFWVADDYVVVAFGKGEFEVNDGCASKPIKRNMRSCPLSVSCLCVCMEESCDSPAPSCAIYPSIDKIYTTLSNDNFVGGKIAEYRNIVVYGDCGFNKATMRPVSLKVIPETGADSKKIIVIS